MVLTALEKRARARIAENKYRKSPKGAQTRAALQVRYRERHRVRRNARQVRYCHRLKDDAFNAYGGWRCACCGELERAFLTLGHMLNNGADERRRWGRNNAGLFRRLKNAGYPAGYRVECFNCNCGSYKNGGVCPHVANR